MDANGKKKAYCSQQQKEKLIGMLKDNSKLISGKFSQEFTFKDAKRKWEEISVILNAIPGAQKDWKQWKKIWQDLRSKTKSKNVELRKHYQGTGGGPPPSESLTKIDEEILSTLSNFVVSGNDKVPETKIEFSFNNESTSVQMENHTVVISEEDFTPPQEQKENATDQRPNTQCHNLVGGKRKTRTVAGKRLAESAIAATALATLTEKKIRLKEEYYNRKLALLERQVVAIEQLVKLVETKK